ncbi:MAG: hypothetical protein IKB53_00980 [Oscillospiraceae bacterium]|nr:hypothetical protein [Oscillospiraceae bacterium]
MSGKNEQDLYQTLTDTQQLLRGLDPTGQRYTLESILAEFSLPDKTEEEPVKAVEEPQQAEVEAAEEIPVAAAPKAAVSVPAPDAEEPEPQAKPAEEFDFENVVAATVGAVLQQNEERSHGEATRKERRQMRRLKRAEKHQPMVEEEEKIDEEAEEAARWAEEEEPEHGDSFRALRREYMKLRKSARWSLLIVAFSFLLTVLGGKMFPASTMAMVQMVLLLVNCFCAAEVFQRAWRAVKERCFSAEVMTTLTVAATLLHGGMVAFGGDPFEPLCVVASLAVTVALHAAKLDTKGREESFRLLAVGEPGHIVCESPDGILRQKGSAAGFSHGVNGGNIAERWQSVLLPVIFTAAVAFSVLASVGQGEGKRFFWCFAVLMTAANGLNLPLCFALPFSRVTRRLYHSGAAIAGYLGARLISRSRRMILTDRDLFPDGSVHLNGIKIYGEEIGKVVSYAASMVRRSESGIAHIFDELLASEGAEIQKVDEFLYADGGYSAIIRGETTLLGTDKFMRHHEVALPGALKLKNALFLAVDGELIAAFAVKYPQLSSTEWAVHSLKRMGIAPVLASRDPNLTPALLKQRFGTDAKAVYPALEERLNLSDHSSRRSCLMGAVLYREGLMPYAEAVVASRRLCRAAHQMTTVSLFGSVLSLLLCFYLSFVGASTVLAPMSLAVYQLLWLFCGILIGFGTDRY